MMMTFGDDDFYYYRLKYQEVIGRTNRLLSFDKKARRENNASNNSPIVA
jgi:hypothetical protein